MKTRFNCRPALFAAAILAGTSAAAFAAPAAPPLPVTQANVMTPPQTVKAPLVLALAPAALPVKASAKVIIPAAPSAVPKTRPQARRDFGYRYSNPSRWNSDAVCNSIRNQ